MTYKSCSQSLTQHKPNADTATLCRWLTEEGQKVGAYLPFGAGARMCPGYHFAQLEIKVCNSLLTLLYLYVHALFVHSLKDGAI